jgi:gentisate 1,2-dioxygenase
MREDDKKKLPRIKTMEEALKQLRALALKTGVHSINPETPIPEIVAQLKAYINARRRTENHQDD